MCKLKAIPEYHFVPLRLVTGSFNCSDCGSELVDGDRYWPKQFKPSSKVKGICVSCFDAMRVSVALERNLHTKTPPKFRDEYIEILSGSAASSSGRGYLTVVELHKLIGVNSSFLDAGVN